MHAQHRMLDADGALDAGQGDVEALGGELRAGGRGVDLVVRVFDRRFDPRLQFVDALADLALCRAGRGLQPGVVDLRQDAVLARQPAVAECLPVGFAVQRGGFGVERGEQIGDGAIQRLGRVVFEFGNGVHEFVCRVVHPSVTDRRRDSRSPDAQYPSSGAVPEGTRSYSRLPSAEALGYHCRSLRETRFMRTSCVSLDVARSRFDALTFVQSTYRAEDRSRTVAYHDSHDKRVRQSSQAPSRQRFVICAVLITCLCNCILNTTGGHAAAHRMRLQIVPGMGGVTAAVRGFAPACTAP